METKEKEIQKKINELCKLMDEKDIFIVFRKRGDVVDIALPSEVNEEADFNISAALAGVIESYLVNNTENEGVERLSEIIIDAIEALIGVSPKAAVKLTTRFAGASMIGIKNTLSELSYDDEDCENCEFLKTCENEAAIKYRKEHGIPKPKKNKKGGRKIDVN